MLSEDGPAAASDLIIQGDFFIPRTCIGLSRGGSAAAGNGTERKISMKKTQDSAQKQYKKEKTDGNAQSERNSAEIRA